MSLLQNQQLSPFAYALLGSVLAIIANGFKENFFFKRTLKKEEKIRALNKIQNDDDLIRSMSAKLVGLNYVLLGALKMYNEKFITHQLYHRMAELERENEALNKFYVDESIAYLKISDSLYEKIMDIHSKYGEIVGEFVYIIPESKVIPLYKDLIALNFYKVFDFTRYYNFAEANTYRTDLLQEYLKVDLENIHKKSVAVMDMIHTEGKEKFNNDILKLSSKTKK